MGPCAWFTRIAAALSMCALAAASQAQDPLLDPAREHLRQGRAQDAVSLLDPLEPILAAERDFNLLHAEALLRAEEPGRALFPINRILRRDPNDTSALLLLSQARIALAHVGRAREALDRAGRGQTTPEVKQRIDQVLSVIAAAEAPRGARIGGYVEVSYGYDSNVNSATGAQQLALPVFGGAIGTLSPAATRQKDEFFALTGNVGLQYPLSERTTLVAGASAFQRFNSTRDEFDLRVIEGSGGLRFTHGENEWTGVFTAQQFEVDYQRLRTTTGGSAQWRRLLTPRTELSAFAQLARLAYPSQRLRDVDRRVAGIALGYALAGERPPIVFGSIFAGEEDERNATVPFFGHRLRGARLGADHRWRDRVQTSVSIGYEERRYGGTDPLFLITRKDEQIDFRLALAYEFAPRFFVAPQLTYTSNRSSVELNRYRRTAIFAALRYAF